MLYGFCFSKFHFLVFFFFPNLFSFTNLFFFAGFCLVDDFFITNFTLTNCASGKINWHFFKYSNTTHPIKHTRKKIFSRNKIRVSVSLLFSLSIFTCVLSFFLASFRLGRQVRHASLTRQRSNFKTHQRHRSVSFVYTTLSFLTFGTLEFLLSPRSFTLILC